MSHQPPLSPSSDAMEAENFRLQLRLFELERSRGYGGQGPPPGGPSGHTATTTSTSASSSPTQESLMHRARDVVRRLEGELTSALSALSATQSSLHRAEEEARGAVSTARAEAAGRRALEAECEVLRGEVLRQREALASEVAGASDMGESLEEAQAQCAAASAQLVETSAAAESLARQCKEQRVALAKALARTEEGEREGAAALVQCESKWEERLRRCTEQLAGALERGSLWERELSATRERLGASEAAERAASIALGDLKRDAENTLGRLEEELGDAKRDLAETKVELAAARAKAKEAEKEAEVAVTEATTARVRAAAAETLVAGERECSRLKEAAGRDALARWLSLVRGKFSGLVSSGSVSGSSSGSGGGGGESISGGGAAVLNPEDTAAVLKALDELPNVHAWFTTASGSLVRQMEARMTAVNTAIESLGTRLKSSEEEAAGSLKVWRERESAAYSAMKAAEGRLAEAVTKAEAAELKARGASVKAAPPPTPPASKQISTEVTGRVFPEEVRERLLAEFREIEGRLTSQLAAALEENSSLKERLGAALKRLEHARAFALPAAVKSSLEREVQGALQAVIDAEASVRASRAHKERVEKWKGLGGANMPPAPKWLAEVKESIAMEAAAAEAAAISSANTAVAVKAHVDTLLVIAVAAASEAAKLPSMGSGVKGGGGTVASGPKIRLFDAVSTAPPTSVVYDTPISRPSSTSLPSTSGVLGGGKASLPLPSLARLSMSGLSRGVPPKTLPQQQQQQQQTQPRAPAPPSSSHRSSMVEFAASLASGPFEERGEEVGGESLGGDELTEDAMMSADEAWAKQHSKTRQELDNMFTLLSSRVSVKDRRGGPENR